MHRPKPHSHRSRIALRRGLLSAGVCVALALASTSPAEAFGPVIYYGVVKVAGLLAGTAKLTDWRAKRAFDTAKRMGTCDDRRQQIVAMLPEVLRFGRYARDVYNDDAAIPTDRPRTKDLGGGRTAVYDPAGKRYAEIRDDPARNEVVIVFRGTRPTVRTDLSTDILYYAGIEPAYYEWGNKLVADVVRSHPGRQVIVTGHSLGGGLAVDAVLRNPGVHGIAFNPAGLSWVHWLAAGHADRARTSAALTIVAQRNASHIDALTELSLSKQTVLPGRMLVVETSETTVREVHSMTTLVESLERVAKDGASGEACEGLLDPLH